MTDLVGTNGADNILGTVSDDTILAGNGNDVVDGGAGNDRIDGGNGNDVVDGGSGNDVINGGNGNDTLNGGLGNDTLEGGNGDDTINGGAGSDRASGGNGNDVLIYRLSENVGIADIYDGGQGQDTLRLIVTGPVSSFLQADIAQLQLLLSHGSATMQFSSMNLFVSSIERLEVIVDTSANHAPTAVNDTATTTEDTAVTISAASLLANDTDQDVGDSRTLVSVQDAQHGTVSLDNGNVVFTPEANYSGVGRFTYTMKDGAGATSTATVEVTIGAVADGPRVITTSATGTADATIPLHITVGLIDPDEVLGQTVEIQGVPSAYALNHGTAPSEEGGAWVVAVTDLPTLALIPLNGAGTPGSFTLHISATSVDGASTATASEDLSVTITPAANQQDGRVVDGYIAGATVFADANNNGILDYGEARTTTNADGTFTLTGGAGPLVMFGGADVSTGVAFNGTMRAPAGSTVITPLTTLVAVLAVSLGNLTAAQDAVAAAFGLDPLIDLQNYDPVPDARDGDADALAVLSAAIQVQSTIAQISAVTHDADHVITAIAGAITGGAVDLSDTGKIQSIATAAGVGATGLAAVTDVVAAANDSIQAASNVTALAQAAQVAQGDATDKLATTNFNDPVQVNALTQTFVTDLGTQIANAQVGALDDPLIGTLGNDPLTGGGGNDAIDGLDGDDQIDGGAGNDFLYGGAGRDTMIGGVGNDLIDGGAGIDLVDYSGAPGPIVVNMDAGTVDGDELSVGHDTLVAVERIRGTNAADSYDATGFNAAGQPQPGTPPSFNEFEGLGGDDTIVGNDNTRLSYQNATAGVTVDVVMGVARATDFATLGDVAGVGTDHFSGVSGVRGSDFDDVLLGRDNPTNVDFYEGRAGNDWIDGRGGLDRAVYNGDNVTGPITVHMAAGTVDGDASIGHDILRAIEGVRGTNFADFYDATEFSATSLNAGSNGTFNDFEGMGGGDAAAGTYDIVIGNGNTRVTYISATAGVTVDLDLATAGVAGSTGTAFGTDAGDPAGVGIDIFKGGINAVRGSTFNDKIYGASGNETFEGWAGDDRIDGRGGFDQARYDNTQRGQSFGALGIRVDLAAGTVDGRDNTALDLVGHDTLISIESIRGTNSADIYNATGFTGDGAVTPSQNAGSNNSSQNQFEGLGGDDQITGNNNTRVIYQSSLDGVTITFTGGGAGNAHGTAAGDVANVGIDTFTGGVTQARGSQFNDVINGSGGNENLDGQGGDDTINGGGGNDVITGGVGDDTIDGGNGQDIAIFSGNFAQYSFASGAGGTLVVSGPDGTDTLSNVELLQFNDAYRVPETSNISALGLITGRPILGGGVDNVLTVSGGQTNGGVGRLIDLDGGNDTLILSAGNNYNLNILNIETLNGSAGNDQVFLRNSFTGTIDLGGGIDSLQLGGSNAHVISIRNVETLNGGTGQETITLLDPVLGMRVNLNSGPDILNLANGINELTLLPQGTTVHGGTGNDHLILETPGAPNISADLQLGGGTDTVTLNVFGASASLGLSGVETLNSTGPVTTVFLTNAVNGLFVDLGTGIQGLNLANGNNTLTVQDVENVAGANGDDHVTLTAGMGVTTINASFDLGAGNDTLTLQVIGTPTLNLALTNVETLDSIGGIETVNLTNVTNGLTVDLGVGFDTLNLATGSNFVTVSNVETLNAFGTGNDQVTFFTDPNVFNQIVNLGFGTDMLNLAGAGGSLTMTVSGGNLKVFDQTVSGDLNLTLLNQQAGTTFDFGAGTDTLSLLSAQGFTNQVTVTNIENVLGSIDSDTIIIGGNTGVTTVTGGLGTDFITASTSEDHIRFTQTAQSSDDPTHDQVTGFDANNDRFVFDQVATMASDIVFIGTGSFSGDHQHSQANLTDLGGGHSLVQIDTDADGFADMAIELIDLADTLQSSNFFVI